MIDQPQYSDFFWKDDGGGEHLMEDTALSYLLRKDCLFVSDGENVFIESDSNTDHRIFLSVNCNDLFDWACSDYEELTFDQIGPLIKSDLADTRFGISKWACKHRGQRPQKPVEDEMRKEGVWDEEMEDLPERNEVS